MRICTTIRTIAVGMALALPATAAHAVTIYYETCAAKNQTLGTIASGGTSTTTPTGGGLCVTGDPGFTPFSSPGLYALGASTVGASNNNLISFTTGIVPIANYNMNFSFNGLVRAGGAIWDVTLINGGVNGTSATSIGTTNAVGAGTSGGGTVSLALNNFTGGTVWIGITNLYAQYNGQADTLPGWALLTTPVPANSSATTASNTNTIFILNEALVSAPEPASATLFTGGIAALGALRRRRH